MKPTYLIAALLAGIAAPAFAQPPEPPVQASVVEPSTFEQDRASILAMAGNFRVRFDMREQTSWRDDYTPIDAATSGGHEVVRVIADTGRFISLQHMLVATHEGQTFIIKHWRQDWTFEPETYLAYAGQGEWRVERIPEERRRGVWSQTVWQVDDSPRYGSYGRWSDTGGVRRWRSDWTWRPLARRDAIRSPRYDRYLGINRHSPTPDGGWIHWQDNEKMGLVEGELVPFVQESVLNTYRPFDDYDVAAADRYWAASSDYWAAVRAEWDRVQTTTGGVRIQEEAQAGNVISGRLLEMGTEIADGELQTAAAIEEARRLIREATGTN